MIKNILFTVTASPFLTYSVAKEKGGRGFCRGRSFSRGRCPHEF